MARATMASLISDLRGMTSAGSADYTIASAPYWTDDQLQDILDRYRYEVRNDLMTQYEELISGTTYWKEFQSEYKWFETTDGGTARFWITGAIGDKQGTADWTMDYRRGLATFNASQGGSARYAWGFSYDLNGAASDVWRQKAGHYAEAIDFSTDNHSIKRSQIAAMCLKMADKFDAMSGVPIVSEGGGSTIIRSDGNVYRSY